MMPTCKYERHNQQDMKELTYSYAGLRGKVTELTHSVDWEEASGVWMVCAGPVFRGETFWPWIKDRRRLSE